jgi:hypothetical protein
MESEIQILYREAPTVRYCGFSVFFLLSRTLKIKMIHLLHHLVHVARFKDYSGMENANSKLISTELNLSFQIFLSFRQGKQFSNPNCLLISKIR